ncbi:hypothetical protein [Enterococcus gallinarum]|uniref:Uncharacterized protein n=1 Tax=Enterococcus gallinarum TaxID=1353 RepID=A0AAE7MQW2_ENTGA|nr:hypothetical protein [Enterococcus gallinarum]MBM6741236.1 hypothetical protein [Enterococcus gallinarum]MDT2678061.1 hypothetical protein [Enterococcus gallinarum]QOG27959.1 hypothetical protein EGM181_12160 [Enterococcus gallinarum]RBT41343.1 hypothetical protein EB54_01331 [Enterococcus gallinarum]ROY69890.1 hypothetical protein EGW90_14650 [Enterococcus gallinarum]
MGKPLLKTLTVVAVGVGSVAICLVGYRQNNQRQYQQRVEYAQTAIASETDSIASLKKEVASLYLNEDRTFLKAGITADDISQLVGKLSMIKVSGEEYGIEENALPADAKEIQKQKQAIDDELKDIEAKQKIQEATDKLFTKGVSNWQKAENDVIIKKDLKETDVGSIRENLNFFEDDKWTALVKEYLGFADAQLDRVTKLQNEFDRMLKDDKVTDAVTYENYLSAVDSISKIRNKDLKEKYTKLAETVASQMGYVGYYSNTTDTATTDDGYSDSMTDSSETDSESYY